MVTPQYVAGFFDGEGCANFQKNIRGIHPHYHPQICLSNNDKPVLEEIQMVYGGKIYERKRPKEERQTRAQSWELRIQTKEKVKNFITEVLPYVIIKGPRLQLIKNMIDIEKRGRFHIEENTPKREAIYQELKALNKKGPKEQTALCQQ